MGRESLINSRPQARPFDSEQLLHGSIRAMILEQSTSPHLKPETTAKTLRRSNWSESTLGKGTCHMLARAVGRSGKGGSCAVLPDVKTINHGSRFSFDSTWSGSCMRSMNILSIIHLESSLLESLQVSCCSQPAIGYQPFWFRPGGDATLERRA